MPNKRREWEKEFGRVYDTARKYKEIVAFIAKIEDEAYSQGVKLGNDYHDGIKDYRQQLRSSVLELQVNNLNYAEYRRALKDVLNIIDEKN